MKKEKLARALNDVDDDLLEKAAPSRKRNANKEKRAVWLSVAACLVLALGLWLFIPFNTDLPDISQYAESEYYGIMQKLNAVTFVKPSFKNNFDKYVLNLFRGASAEDESSPMDSGDEATGYREVTDNQVQGVIEGDKIKRSTEHIFYLDGQRLSVYSIAGTASTKVGGVTISLGNSENPSYKYAAYAEKWELFLSADCRTVTVLAPYYDYNAKHAFVDVVSLDVSALPAITVKGRITVSGSYESSRMVDGELLLMTAFRVNSNPDFSDEASFLPQIDNGQGRQSLAAADIISPDTLSSASYTVVCKLEEATITLLDSAAFLSYPGAIYVSSEEIFATRTYGEEIEIDGKIYDRTMTEISRMDYSGDILVYKGSISVKGSVLDQYSMDVYEGVLRVVTTTSEVLQRESKDGNHVIYDVDVSGTTNADLYCIDLASGQILASVIAFAPRGESVQSARFDGDAAYICTAVRLSDPVFFFDLSDYSSITYKESDTMTGYSTSLVNFGDGYLLGIGVGETWDSLKIEIYEEGESGVVSVCKYELTDATYAGEYKAYFIDRENRLVGLGVTLDQQEEKECYILLCFDGYQLRRVLDVPLAGANTQKRAVLIDGCLYLFGENEFRVTQIY